MVMVLLVVVPGWAEKPFRAGGIPYLCPYGCRGSSVFNVFSAHYMAASLPYKGRNAVFGALIAVYEYLCADCCVSA